MTEVNIIVYSIFLREGLQTQAYLELLYSLKTLRERSLMPVKVFISPANALLNCPLELEIRTIVNVEVLFFDNSVEPSYPTYVSEGFAQLLDHRWRNALRAFELFPVDRILYLDSDTIFHRPIEQLFECYSERSCLWARLDVTPDISQPIGLEYGMNDGQFILSREVKDKLAPGFYERQRQEITTLLTRAKPLLSPEKHRHLHWLSAQYSVLKLLTELNVQVKEFSKSHVMISTEPTYAHRTVGCQPEHILHHYFSGNLQRYLPFEYWAEYNKQKYKRLGFCSCGHQLDA